MGKKNKNLMAINTPSPDSTPVFNTHIEEWVNRHSQAAIQNGFLPVAHAHSDTISAAVFAYDENLKPGILVIRCQSTGEELARYEGLPVRQPEKENLMAVEKRWFAYGINLAGTDYPTAVVSTTLLSSNGSEDLADADAQTNAGAYDITFVGYGYKNLPDVE